MTRPSRLPKPKRGGDLPTRGRRKLTASEPLPAELIVSDGIPPMPVWELINPSDCYTFEAPNIEVAGVVAVFLSTSFGAKRIDQRDDERTPVLFGWNEWLEDRGINEAWIDEHAGEIAAAFDSFLIGSYQQRLDYLAILAAVPVEKRREVIAERQERRRTSMNKIGEAAAAYARHFDLVRKKREAAHG